MSHVDGIEVIRNEKGEITHLTIDVKKHPDLAAPFLKLLGIEKNNTSLQHSNHVDRNQQQTLPQI